MDNTTKSSENTPRTAMQWVKDNKKPIAIGCAIYLWSQNRRLVQENQQLLKKLDEASGLLRTAATQLEAVNLFDYYFGPRSKN